jgi:hypothetical protein
LKMIFLSSVSLPKKALSRKILSGTGFFRS